MSTRENFYNDLAKGEEREILFMNWCNGKGKEFIDVRDSEEWRKKDVDFLMTSIKNNKPIPIDVKMCSLKDGAIAIETKSGKAGINEGWWNYSASRWFVFTSKCNTRANADTYMIITLHRNWIQKWLEKYQPRTQWIGDGKGAYVKLNGNNKYQKDRETIIEFIKNEGLTNSKFYFYVDKDGKEVEPKANELFY